MSGVGLLPMLVFAGIGSFMGGGLNKQRDNTFYTATVGSLAIVIGTAALTTLDNHVRIEAACYAFAAFVGFGFGMSASTATLTASLDSDSKDTSKLNPCLFFPLLGSSSAPCSLI